MSKWYPRCFSSAKQYDQWRHYASFATVGRSQWCTDCTPQYRDKMIEQGRCAFPLTVFRTKSNGMIEGYRRASKESGGDLLPEDAQALLVSAAEASKILQKASGAGCDMGSELIDAAVARVRAKCPKRFRSDDEDNTERTHHD